MKKNIDLTEPSKGITIDNLNITDPIIYTDDKGYHIIGLTKQKSGNTNMVYLFTENFTDFNIVNRELIVEKENSDIWGGCIFYDKGEFHIFYTVRSSENGYWAKQTIKRIVTKDFKTVDFKNLNLTPELADNNENIFQYLPNKDSYTIHSWRDPFIFKHDGKFYMLISAKLNRKHFNATIALLVSNDLDNWTLVNPSIVPNNGEFEELELPSVFINNSNEIMLMTCCWEQNDYLETGNNGYTPLNNEKGNNEKIVRRKGMLLVFKAQNIENALLGQFKFESKIETPSNFYAGCFVPDQNVIIGHDKDKSSLIMLKHNTLKVFNKL
jgi:hypothetical protein